MLKKHLGESCEKVIVPIVRLVVEDPDMDKHFKTEKKNMISIATEISKNVCIPCIVKIAESEKGRDICNKDDGEAVKGKVKECIMNKIMGSMSKAMGLVGKVQDACDKPPTKEMLKYALGHVLVEIVSYN